MNPNLITAINAAIAAGKEILDVYGLPKIEVENKEDDSPLTLADKKANDVINQYLVKTQIPIISEENKESHYQTRKDWPYCWIVDPLDGTKEFIKRNGEFTVNIALCNQGIPELGVIYVPVERSLYYADVLACTAFKMKLNNKHDLPADFNKVAERLSPELEQDPHRLRVVASRSHMNDLTTAYIAQAQSDYDDIEVVSKGSSLKFCLLAEGLADVYPRFAPTMEWDTAAGQAICTAAGLDVVSQATKTTLVYNKENLLNPHFIVKKK